MSLTYKMSFHKSVKKSPRTRVLTAGTRKIYAERNTYDALSWPEIQILTLKYFSFLQVEPRQENTWLPVLDYKMTSL